MEKELIALVDKAQKLGLNELNISYALEYIEHREYGLAIDQILTQINEYGISVDNSFLDLAHLLLKKMHLENEYGYLKELNKEDLI